MTTPPTPPLSRFQLRLTAVVATVLIAVFIWAATSAVLVAFIGILFSVFFSAMAAGVAGVTSLGYRWALAVTMLLLVVLFGLAMVFVAPRAAEEARKLRQDIPSAWNKARQRIADTSWGRTLLDQGSGERSWMPEAQTLTSGAAGVFTGAVGAASGAIAALFLGLFLAVEPRTYVGGFVSLFAVHRRQRVRDVLGQIGRVLRRWLLAKLISMVIVGVLTGTGLWLLGIPLAFSLGVLASLLTFIPNIGPVLAALPALLLAFVDSPTRALYVALLYLGVQAVESYGITPFIERETVSLPPAVTLATQLALGLLAGFAGVIVAAPLAAVGVVLVQTFYIQDVLGDGRQESIGENP